MLSRQAGPVIRQQVEVEQPLASGGQADNALQVKRQTTLIQYIPEELWFLMKQVRQRDGERVLGWLLRLWDDGAKGTELSLKKMA